MDDELAWGYEEDDFVAPRQKEAAQKVVECAECGLMERRDMIRRHGWLICADGVLLCSFQCQCDYRSKKRTEMRELFGTGGKETQCKTMNG